MAVFNVITVNPLEVRGKYDLSSEPTPIPERFKDLERIENGRHVLRHGKITETVRVVQEALNYVKSGGAVTEVKKSDHHLIRQGYLVTDGDFRGKTEARVQQYQESIRKSGTLVDGRKMVVDKEVGTQMRKALQADIQRIAGEQQLVALQKEMAVPPALNVSELLPRNAHDAQLETAAVPHVVNKAAEAATLAPVTKKIVAPSTAPKNVDVVAALLPENAAPKTPLSPMSELATDIKPIAQSDYLRGKQLQTVVYREYGAGAKAALANPASDYRQYLETQATGGLKRAYTRFEKWEQQGREVNLTSDRNFGTSTKSKLVLGYLQFKEAQTTTYQGSAIKVDGYKGPQTQALLARVNQRRSELLTAEIGRQVGVSMQGYKVKQKKDVVQIITEPKNGLAFGPGVYTDQELAPGVTRQAMQWSERQEGKRYGSRKLGRNYEASAYDCMSFIHAFAHKVDGTKADYGGVKKPGLHLFMHKYTTDVGTITLGKGRNGLVIEGAMPSDIKVGSMVGFGPMSTQVKGGKDIWHGGIISGIIRDGSGQPVDYYISHASSARKNRVTVRLSDYLKEVRNESAVVGKKKKQKIYTHRKAYIAYIGQHDPSQLHGQQVAQVSRDLLKSALGR